MLRKPRRAHGGRTIWRKWDSASVSDRNTRVINGNEAGVQQFPHQAGIYVNLNTFCGGALISPKWILTTATCADSPNARYTVYLGAHNINLPSEKNRRVVTTTQSYAHEGFDASTFRHDVGLILLPRDVKMSDYIKTINLPPKAYASETFSGVSLQLSGWGYTSDVSSTISPKLQYTDLKGVDAKACVETYSYEIYTDAILCCVGGNKQSSCQGDTGGALVKTEVDGSLTHIAVASFTPQRGCSTGKPAGFTRTASYLDWISSVAGIAVN